MGAKIMARTTVEITARRRNVKTTLLISLALSLPSLTWASFRTGINEIVSAPSAKSRLKTLGTMKATKKASATWDTPKRPAMTMSLIRPNMRLMDVKKPTRPAPFMIFLFSDITRGMRYEH